MTRTAKVDVSAQYSALYTSLQALPDAESVILQGKAYKKADLVSTFQGCLAAIATTEAAHTQWLKASASEKATLAAARPLRSSLKSYLDARLGKANPDLSTFGFKPAKPAQKTVKVKSAAVAKAAATRQARHTMGSQQKKEVKGAAPATPAVTPVSGTQPAAATPAASNTTPHAS